jgi:hypothetical protein
MVQVVATLHRRNTDGVEQHGRLPAAAMPYENKKKTSSKQNRR